MTVSSADADLLSGRAGNPEGGPSVRMAALLGRTEGRRMAGGLAGLSVLFVVLVTLEARATQPSTENDWVFAYSVNFACLLAALGALLVLNLAATRERRARANGLLDAAPGSSASRTGGVLVAALVPATAILLLTSVLGPIVALFTEYEVGDAQISLLAGQGVEGLADLARLAELVLLGGVLGVVLGMWLGRFWLALLATPVLFGAGVGFGMWGNGGDYAWLAPNASLAAIDGAYDYACEVDAVCLLTPQPLGDFTPYGHLIYVAALCAFLAALALLRRSRSWLVLLSGGVSLAVSVGMGLALVG